jgi:predicted permease
MTTILADLRFAIRLLFRSPVLTAVAALSLGLGIGANTLIFSLVNEVFLRPLPLRDADRLISVFTSDARNSDNAFGGFLNTSRLNYEDYRQKNEVFDTLAAHAGAPLSISGGSGEPEQIFGEIVSGNYFETLGAPMRVGRPFTPEEDAKQGAAPVTVLSYGLWQRRFGGDATIVGRTITVNGRAFAVLGVTAESFKGTNAIGGPQLWVPFAMYREVLSGFQLEGWDSRRSLLFNITGRLKPGVSVEQAQANMSAIAAALAQEYPNENGNRTATLVPLAEATINPGFRGIVVNAGGLLMVVVGLVLLVACANVANLLLARAASRKQEIAVRLSLGASRGRLVRQLMIESIVLSLVGGAAGFLIALWTRPALRATRPPFLPDDALAVTIDGTVLLFTAAIALGTGVLFGLVPALQFSRPDLATELKDRSSVTGAAAKRFTPRNALVVLQVALSFVALIGAGLFLRSLGQAQLIDPGFDSSKLAVMSFNLTAQGLSLEAASERQRQILERVRGLGGVERASYASFAALGGGGFLRSVFLEGQDVTDRRAGRLVQINNISDDYFETMAIPILRGRDFTDRDTVGTPQVVIINETMAKRFWPDQDPLGKRFRFFGQEQLTEVVGIARDSKYNFIGEAAQPFIYQPLRQTPQPAVTLQVRSANPESMLGSVRSVVQQMEPNMPLVGVFTMRNLFDQALWAPRMGALLLAIFGGLALLLASIGVYGVMAYAVSQRQRELGIRLALGATSGEVRGMVFRQGLGLTIVGVVVGLLAALGLTRLVANLLFNMSPMDPVTFTLIPIVLVAVASLAIYLPARRASRVDPVEALRSV